MKKTFRVLIVEDSEDDAELIARQIKRAGYDLIYKRVDSAVETSDLLRKETWDVVIADFSMPNFSGLQALEILKKSGLDLPFILISGIIGEDIAVQAMKSGAHDYLMKDNLTRLVPAIEREIREAAVRAVKGRIENERIVLINQLQEALRVRDEFLLIASHELKTPLTSVKLQMALMKRTETHSPQEEKERRRKEVILSLDHQIERLEQLIENLFDVSRISVGKFTINYSKLDLASVVRETMQNLREDLKQARCHVELRANIPAIGEWDRLRMEQVILNLVGNAMKHAPGSPIRIAVEPLEQSVRLTIQDQGPGITKENQKKLFQRFERASSSVHVGGLGLGLYITKQIVEAHGGRIRLESEPGQGSTFIIEIPIK